MPTKQVSFCNDKKVVVRVYVEKPRKKRSSSIQHQYQIHGPISMGCGRRAGLLSYSHLLRESARGALSAPSFSKWVTNTNLQPPTQGRFLVLQITPSNMKKPTCFGSCTWKLLIPRFLRSCSKAKKKENKKKHMGADFSGNGMRMICCYRS
ncbi:hypothetical protein VIGAN_01371200 [Vigna angularis var. angularis]|uniref:Uncharacterized protein n=1 Tax=Vigna angularis var. angularis TaxID=157739 RepID=A0A0S3R5H5_PHAAN|nr:uncharacterized protein LOC108340705 isoform X1 [Vigna angularis]BAT75792.1 hypothetical protein VIGAN_01371200 [Vigna angularis var. angularis]